MKNDPSIININGKIPGSQSIAMQSAPDTTRLKRLITDYLVRVMRTEASISDIETVQKIFGMPAAKVPELQPYDFEVNQRVDDLLAIVMIAESTSALSNLNMIPAWQRPRQDDAMESFTGKKSWDGFIYQHVSMDQYKPALPVMPVPIEVKSLKIHPHKEKFSGLNDLLTKKLPKFSEHFQKEATIAAVVVFPLNSGSEIGALRFDLKDATLAMNRYVANNVVGCLLFIDIITDSENYVNLGIKCTFVSKSPNFADNGNIDSIKLFETKLARFKM